MGAEIAAIAVTATFSQQAFAEHLGVSFPLLSDWDREACADYGVRYETCACRCHDEREATR
jgi:peroxiredoxin